MDIAFFPPKAIFPAHTIQSQLRLFDKGSREKLLDGSGWGIQRAEKQIYAARQLHKTAHGAKAKSSVQQMIQRGFRVNILDNQSNHLFCEEDQLRPVVLNAGMAVEEMSKVMMMGVWSNLSEILDKSKIDSDRNLLTLNLGLSSVQAPRWWEHEGVKMPGTMSVMDKLSPQLKLFVGKMSILLAEGIQNGGKISMPFLPYCPKRRVLLDHLGRALGVEDKELNEFRFEGIALVLGNGTEMHYDSLNDSRVGYDWTVVGSIIIDAARLGWGSVKLKRIA